MHKNLSSFNRRDRSFHICNPVLASDPPTDDGQYIWQDENGDYWYRNGSEDEYIGEGNYAPDPDSGELMEGNDAGWTEQDGYFEPHYYYEGRQCVAGRCHRNHIYWLQR